MKPLIQDHLHLSFNSFDLFCEPLSVWLGVVEEYLQGDIAKDEKEAKKWANAEKSMEAKMHRKRTLDNRGKSVLGQCHRHHQCLLHPSHSCLPGLLSLEDPPCFHCLQRDTSKLSAGSGG